MVADSRSNGRRRTKLYSPFPRGTLILLWTFQMLCTSFNIAWGLFHAIYFMSDEVDTVESNSLQAVTSITAVINIVLFIWMIVNITRFDHFHLTTSEYRMETWAAVFISALGTGINMAILNFIAGGVAAAQLLFACLSWWVGWRTGRIVVRGELGEMRKPVLAEMGETGGNNRNDGAELRTLRISTSMGNHRSGQKVSSDSTVVNEVPRTSSRPPSYRAEEVV